MRKLIILLTFVLLIAASTSFAGYDPGQNRMGLYWDLDGEDPWCEYTPTPTNLYLLFTNPTMDSIGGFECGIDMAGTAYLLSATFANPQALDVASGFQNFIVGFGSPTTCTQNTLLVTLLVMNISVELGFYLHAANPASIEGDLPVMLFVNGDMQPIQISTLPNGLSAQMCSARTRGYVATEKTTWDSLKSLYR